MGLEYPTAGWVGGWVGCRTCPHGDGSRGTASLAGGKSRRCPRRGGAPFRNRLPRSGCRKFGRNFISVVLLLTESRRMKISDCGEGQADSLLILL